MAHMFHKHGGTLEIDVIALFANFAVGGTGAVGTVTGKGVTSVTRNSAGNYTVLFDDTYNATLFADVKLLHSSADNPTTAGILTRLVATNAQASGGATLQVQFVSVTDGGAIDPASGSTVYVKAEFRKSSVV